MNFRRDHDHCVFGEGKAFAKHAVIVISALCPYNIKQLDIMRHILYNIGYFVKSIFDTIYLNL